MRLYDPYRRVGCPELSDSQRQDLHRGYRVDLDGDLKTGDVFISVHEGEEIVAQCVRSTDNGRMGIRKMDAEELLYLITQYRHERSSSANALPNPFGRR